jgi:hypothetical protein
LALRSAQLRGVEDPASATGMLRPFKSAQL